MAVEWLGDPLMISNSEIQTWKMCRRKWYVQYYRELGPPKTAGETGALPLGAKIHTALEGLYSDGQDPIEIINDIYLSEIKSFEADPKGQHAEVLKSLRSEHELAKAMLEGYIEWVQDEGIDAGLKPISSEEVIISKSGINGVLLRGRLDARFEREVDGARVFRDYKTVQEMTTPVKMLQLDEQFRMYSLLEYLKALEEKPDEVDIPIRTDGGLYTMLRKVKRTASARPPFYGQVEVRFNKAVLKNMWIRVHKVIEEIVQARQALDAGSDHNYVCPPTPSRYCTWGCPHYAICPMMDDGSNYEGLMAEYYVHVDPNERYQEEEQIAKGSMP